VREIGIFVSCGDFGERGWRTELDLGSCKSLDDRHAAATFGTEPKWAGFLGGGGFWFSLRWRCCVECLKAERQESGAAPLARKPKW
jgi:hypothetical protein